jgi:hypothetical protein
MSKRFKGKTCVYCTGEGISQTADHVIAREFLPVAHRGDLPKVPACEPCNHAKSRLEHYLLAVLPFGSRHPAASSMLEAEVPRRLAGNRSLHRALAANQQNAWLTENGVTQRTITIPFEGERLDALFALVTRGLTAHHFGVVIPNDYYVGAGTLASAAEPFMMSLLAMNARAKVSRSIGNGLISYEGAQGTDDPNLTVWRYRIYGGIRLSDAESPGEMPDTIWASSSRLRSQSVFSV